MLVAKPSSFVARCLSRFPAQVGATALDVPCGYGRHTLAAVGAGYTVTAIDRSDARTKRLREMLREAERPDAAVTIVADVNAFDFGSIGPFDLAIVTDFVSQTLIRSAISRLKPGGHLIYETFGSRGGNWRELPRRGEVAATIAEFADMVSYDERLARNAAGDAVVVKCFARRR